MALFWGCVSTALQQRISTLHVINLHNVSNHSPLRLHPTVPIQVNVLYCEFVTSGTASVLWAAQTNAQQYILTVESDEASTPSPKFFVAGDELEAFYDNLEAGVVYRLCVQVTYTTSQQPNIFCKSVRTSE